MNRRIAVSTGGEYHPANRGTPRHRPNHKAKEILIGKF